MGQGLVKFRAHVTGCSVIYATSAPSSTQLSTGCIFVLHSATYISGVFSNALALDTVSGVFFATNTNAEKSALLLVLFQLGTPPWLVERREATHRRTQQRNARSGALQQMGTNIDISRQVVPETEYEVGPGLAGLMAGAGMEGPQGVAGDTELEGSALVNPNLHQNNRRRLQ